MKWQFRFLMPKFVRRWNKKREEICEKALFLKIN